MYWSKCVVISWWGRLQQIASLCEVGSEYRCVDQVIFCGVAVYPRQSGYNNSLTEGGSE